MSIVDFGGFDARGMSMSVPLTFDIAGFATYIVSFRLKGNYQTRSFSTKPDAMQFKRSIERIKGVSEIRVFVRTL